MGVLEAPQVLEGDRRQFGQREPAEFVAFGIHLEGRLPGGE